MRAERTITWAASQAVYTDDLWEPENGPEESPVQVSSSRGEQGGLKA